MFIGVGIAHLYLIERHAGPILPHIHFCLYAEGEVAGDGQEQGDGCK